MHVMPLKTVPEKYTDTLIKVVEINEELKHVRNIAMGMPVLAINAMLTAKRAGGAVKGFGVASSELRIFSSRLTISMENISVHISAMVGDVARLLHARRVEVIMLAIEGHNGVSAALMRYRLQREERMAILEKDWKELTVHIRRALQLSETGRSLGRSARIEAVYGGKMAGALRMVADSINEMVERIRDALNMTYINVMQEGLL